VLLDRATLRRLCRARDLLAQPEDAPSIAEVARRVGISRAHFIRQFDAAFGATPHQWRTRVRLDRAKLLLARGASVTEACFDVGFSSLGSFSTLFAQRVGAPPSAYRRRFVQVPDVIRALHPGCLALLAHLPADAFRTSREARAAAPGHAPPR